MNETDFWIWWDDIFGELVIFCLFVIRKEVSINISFPFVKKKFNKFFLRKKKSIQKQKIYINFFSVVEISHIEICCIFVITKVLHRYRQIYTPHIHSLVAKTTLMKSNITSRDQINHEKWEGERTAAYKHIHTHTHCVYTWIATEYTAGQMEENWYKSTPNDNKSNWTCSCFVK